ncbi:M-phase inducer phosphatase 1-B-like [Denticeps clupeoides]|uniref:M-phase inducer phosphatase n=1 Tax=Denticeps clupeoides TaxID=299321 RepID=A0AAY4DGP6_9TELE|nr:M-phase inducer phosphatase 3 [Denticeps clupeoides]
MDHPLLPGSIQKRKGPPLSPDLQASPMTELAHCFTGLSAFRTGDTPRRCLDLSNISSGSADEAVMPGSPHSTRGTEKAPLTPAAETSPIPRNSRTKRLRTCLPRLICSSPKLPATSGLRNNKENVLPGDQWEIPGKLYPPRIDPSASASPIYPEPPSYGCSIEPTENQHEDSVEASMSSSMAQLLSEPLMNQDVNLSSKSVCLKAGHRLFRSPSMPESLERMKLKRFTSSPQSNPPLKRHRTNPAIMEEEPQDQYLALDEGYRPLLKKTVSLFEVNDHHLIGDSYNTELIGDFSKVCALPTVTGRHQDLKYITGETMCALLEGCYSCLVELFLVVDCRYPYEYQGGHIKGALNLPNSDEAVKYLLSQQIKQTTPDKRVLLVLHCEFSSERAPRTCRLLRSVDRSRNEYPYLNYPELYILKGGYRDFYQSYREHCEPQSYCPMHHQDHREELLRCRMRSRATAEDRRRQQLVSRLGKS